MRSENDKILNQLVKYVDLTPDQIQEIRDNFQLYERSILDLLAQASKYTKLKEDFSRLLSDEARLNYENYETYMAVHTNSIAISGHRAAIRISGQRLSKDIEIELEDLLSKYLMMKF